MRFQDGFEFICGMKTHARKIAIRQDQGKQKKRLKGEDYPSPVGSVTRALGCVRACTSRNCTMETSV